MCIRDRSYANCGLPYYVGGVIKEQEELTLQTPESFWDRFRIDVRVRQEVTAINPAEKTVTVRALDSGKTYTETYDKLLLAPGAKPPVPALSGVDSERVFTLRTVAVSYTHLDVYKRQSLYSVSNRSISFSPLYFRSLISCFYYTLIR